MSSALQAGKPPHLATLSERSGRAGPGDFTVGPTRWGPGWDWAARVTCELWGECGYGELGRGVSVHFREPAAGLDDGAILLGSCRLLLERAAWGFRPLSVSPAAGAGRPLRHFRACSTSSCVRLRGACYVAALSVVFHESTKTS